MSPPELMASAAAAAVTPTSDCRASSSMKCARSRYVRRRLAFGSIAGPQFRPRYNPGEAVRKSVVIREIGPVFCPVMHCRVSRPAAVAASETCQCHDLTPDCHGDAGGVDVQVLPELVFDVPLDLFVDLHGDSGSHDAGLRGI